MGSHVDIARRLEPHGAEGLTLGELASTDFAEGAAPVERAIRMALAHA